MSRKIATQLKEVGPAWSVPSKEAVRKRTVGMRGRRARGRCARAADNAAGKNSGRETQRPG